MASANPTSGAGPKITVHSVDKTNVKKQVKASGKYGAMVLNCMDKRLVAYIELLMQREYGTPDHAGYYQVSLAGGALAAHLANRPSWGITFRDHLDIVPGLLQDPNLPKDKQKKFGGIVIIDHRNCGATIRRKPKQSLTPTQRS
jgi:hypothetical protein